MSLKIRPVESAQDKAEFLYLPWRLYRDDPNWIPPILMSQEELVGFQPHPFYAHNEVRTFIAEKQGFVCGRIAAIVNRGHVERYNESVGFFGFFECVDDQAIAQGLIEAARGWLAEQGMTRIRGPVNPSLNHEVGLLVDGFHEPPMFQMTYNHPYYSRLLAGCGLEKCQDLFAFWGHVSMLNKLDKKMAFVVEEATKRFDVKMRHPDMANFDREVRIFLDIYNQALGGTWGFVPISEPEIERMAGDMKHLLIPELTSIAEVDGKPVGAAFVLLDYNPLLREIDGGLFPLGALWLLARRRGIKRLRFMSTDVVPAYQTWGLGLVVLAHLIPSVLEFGIEETEFSWVLETNHLSAGTLRRGGAKLTKTYRIYEGSCGV